MSPEAETVTRVVRIADADGRPIREGSVLQEVKGTTRGVVSRIVRKDDTSFPFAACVGDVVLQTSCAAAQHFTSRYEAYRHVPKDKQTYLERYLSWLCSTPKRTPTDEACAYQTGILALLPDSVVDWDGDRFPDTPENVLWYLAEHLEKLQGDIKKLRTAADKPRGGPGYD